MKSNSSLEELTAQPAKVFQRFESLGNNCEFGLAQRHFGFESHGLLRWGALRGGIPALIAALDNRFFRAGACVGYHLLGTEIISEDVTYELVFHTERHEGQIDINNLLRTEKERISYLARNLIECIADHSKVFVYKHVIEPSQADIMQLLAAINRIGDASLLWVTTAPAAAKVGSVDVLAPRLFRGYIDRFSPEANVPSYCSFDVWHRLCWATLEIEQSR